MTDNVVEECEEEEQDREAQKAERKERRPVSTEWVWVSRKQMLERLRRYVDVGVRNPRTRCLRSLSIRTRRERLKKT